MIEEKDLNRLNESDTLLMDTIRALPTYNEFSERYGVMLMFKGGVITDSLTRKGSHPYRIAVELEEPEEGDWVPREHVFLLSYSEALEDYVIAREYLFKYGGLLNAARDYIERVRHHEEVCDDPERIEDFDKIVILFDDPADRQLRTNSNEILLPFLEGGYTPYHYPADSGLDEYRYDYFVHSLADIFYYAIVKAKRFYKKGAAIKHCKACGKIFFPRRANQKRCYFPSEDEKYGEYTCAEISRLQKQLEESKHRTYESKLHNIRNTCNQRTGKESKEEGQRWLQEFEIAHERKLDEVKNDIRKYRRLVDWIKEYCAEHPLENAKRSKKKAE